MIKRLLLGCAALAFLAAPTAAQTTFSGWEGSYSDFSRLWQGAVGSSPTSWDYAIRGPTDATVYNPQSTALSGSFTESFSFTWDGTGTANLTVGNYPTSTATGLPNVNTLVFIGLARNGGPSNIFFDVYVDGSLKYDDQTLIASSGPSGWAFRDPDLANGFSVSGTMTYDKGTSGSTYDPAFYLNAGTSTPEPASLLLLFTGLAGVAGVAYRRRQDGSDEA